MNRHCKRWQHLPCQRVHTTDSWGQKLRLGQLESFNPKSHLRLQHWRHISEMLGAWRIKL
jgi:hypothetical protein